ncbi:hypothetical protein, partial [Duncaniella muris]|uniref:hypothetical protein n=1 Tax=Duncaniella muris TaxID=2094150 RepID=UPI00351DA649
ADESQRDRIAPIPLQFRPEGRGHKEILEHHQDTPEALKMWMDAGVQYLSYSVDVGIFGQACRGLVTDFQNMRKSVSM